MSDEQTKFDTAQIKAIVEDALASALINHPTRSEVQVMISNSVSASIDGLRQEIRTERVEQNRQLEQTLSAQIDRLAGIVNTLSETVRDHRRQVDSQVTEIRRQTESNRGELISFDARMDSATLLANSTYRAVFGAAGDGPDSLFKMIRELREEVRGMTEKFEPRIEALEVKERWRSGIERTVLQAAHFAVSRRGMALIITIAAMLLGLAGRETIAQIIQTLLQGVP